jgi:hypothetical protein
MRGAAQVDRANLRKVAIVSAAIGLVFAMLVDLGLSVPGLWGFILALVWAFCGGYYANVMLASRRTAPVPHLALNGSIAGSIAALAYWLLSGILAAVRSLSFQWLVSLSPVLEAALIGALASIAWYTYKRNP